MEKVYFQNWKSKKLIKIYKKEKNLHFGKEIYLLKFCISYSTYTFLLNV